MVVRFELTRGTYIVATGDVHLDFGPDSFVEIPKWDLDRDERMKAGVGPVMLRLRIVERRRSRGA